jgi:hypothetical protein
VEEEEEGKWGVQRSDAHCVEEPGITEGPSFLSSWGPMASPLMASTAVP